MYRLTTPTHTFTLPEDTGDYAEILVTYKQKKTVLNKHYQNGTLPSGMSLDGNNVIIKLTQRETKAFSAGDQVSVQIRVLTPSGDAYASQSFKVRVFAVLNEEVLE